MVKDWFGLGAGPGKFRLDAGGTHMKNLATTALQEIESAKRSLFQLRDKDDSGSILVSREKRKRAEALNKAREVRKSLPKRQRMMDLLSPAKKTEQPALRNAADVPNGVTD